jgi:CheY-like chemotaxis protein
MAGAPRTILVVEDSPIDFEAVSRGFRKAGCADKLVNVVDGDEALDFLYRRGKYAGNGDWREPALVLLDLNLPGSDGRSVLCQIRANESTKQIPVVALTTSIDPSDVHACYELGVDTYLQKPASLEEFYEMILRVKEYWLDTAILPGGS